MVARACHPKLCGRLRLGGLHLWQPVQKVLKILFQQKKAECGDTCLQGAGGMVQTAEHLSSKCKVVSSNFNTAK
jgi:hypothetical protein